MVNVLSVVSVFTLSFSAFNAVAHGHAHSPRHHNRGDAVMRPVAFGRDVNSNLTPLQAEKKRSNGLDARRCKAQHTTTTTSSSTTSTSTTSKTTTTTSNTPKPKNVEKVEHSTPSQSSTTHTSSTTPHPKPTHHYDPPTTTTTTKQPSPTTTSGGGGGGGGGGTYSGDGTYYAIGTNACGGFDTEPALIVAASKPLWDTKAFAPPDGNPNHSPICGRMITAHSGGKSVTVKVTDQCVGCSMYSLDFSEAAFKALAGGLGAGRIPITWNWA